MNVPHANTVFPLPNYDKLCFLKNIITRPNIEVGEYTYYDDFENVYNFEKNVKYHFDFTGDKLIIGKFCMIASGVTFITNGANYLTEAVSTYPFAIFGVDGSNALDTYSIVCGNPAAAIRKRFTDEQITALLPLQWRNCTIEKITANVQKLTNNDDE